MYEYSLDLSPSSPSYKRILEFVNTRYVFSARRLSTLHDKWRKSEDQFVAYAPERDVDAVRRNDRELKGVPQYTTIVLPYTYAMLMSAHSYWTTVFLARDPVFQFMGRHGESEQQTQALEALIAYQLETGQMLSRLFFWLFDAGKYGIGIIGDYWAHEQNYISRVVEIEDMLLGVPTGSKRKQLVSEVVRGYSGNKLFNIRPYDYFPDTRVPMWDPNAGEYVSYHQEKNWLELLRLEEAGTYVNTKLLKAKGLGGRNTGRVTGSPRVELPNDESQLFSERDISDTGQYGLLTMVTDIVPSKMGLSQVAHPEKWVFVCGLTGGSEAQMNVGPGRAEVVIQARPLGCDHNKFPVSVLEMEPEAYGLAPRSMPEIIKPIQNTVDWLINSHMYNVRKTMNNQFVADPSKIVMSDFSDPRAGGAIRMKPSAWGTDVRTALQQLQVVDLTRGHMADLGAFDMFAQKAVGVNEQLMGQTNTGGRKTAQEIRTSSTFGINRQKTISEYYSMLGFSPLSQRLVSNSQQYYEDELKLRIVGDLIMEAGPGFLSVTPDAIGGFYDFVPVDGTMPIDRFQMASLWQQMFGQIARIPQIAMEYDLGRVFAWVAQLAGLRNIRKFKNVRSLVAPPGVDPSQLQIAGSNVVPLPRTDLGRPAEPGQTPGMGTTG